MRISEARHYQGGFSLLFIVGALVALGAIATAVTTMTPSATLTELAANNNGQAYYAALSGINYAKTLTDAQLAALNTAGETTFTLSDTARYTLLVDAKSSGKYPTRSIGTSNAGTSREANFITSTISITPVSTPTEPTKWSGGDYVVLAPNSATALPQNATVNGSVAGQSILLNQRASVTGDVVSLTSAQVGQYGHIYGSLCASAGDVLLNQYAEVEKDISANGNLTVGQYAIAHANAYVTGSITMNQYAKIMLIGQAGGAINRAQYDFIGTPRAYSMPTVTCPAALSPSDTSIPSSVDNSKPNAPASTLASPIPAGTYKALTTNQHGSVYLKSGNYTFGSIGFNQYTNMYLDISSGQPLTILVSGDVTTAQYTYVWIKTTPTGEYTRVAATTPHSAASLIYLGANGTVLFNQYSEWFGTVWAKTSLTTGQYFDIIGTLATPGTINLNQGLNVIEYVLADYAKTNWK